MEDEKHATFCEFIFLGVPRPLVSQSPVHFGYGYLSCLSQFQFSSRELSQLSIEIRDAQAFDKVSSPSRVNSGLR
jgi:hypothetical protein